MSTTFGSCSTSTACQDTTTMTTTTTTDVAVVTTSGDSSKQQNDNKPAATASDESVAVSHKNRAKVKDVIIRKVAMLAERFNVEMNDEEEAYLSSVAAAAAAAENDGTTTTIPSPERQEKIKHIRVIASIVAASIGYKARVGGNNEEEKDEMMQFLEEELFDVGFGTLTIAQLVSMLQSLNRELLLFYNSGPCFSVTKLITDCMEQQQQQQYRHKIPANWELQEINNCVLYQRHHQECLEKNRNLIQLLGYHHLRERIDQTLDHCITQESENLCWRDGTISIDWRAWRDHVAIRGWTTTSTTDPLQRQFQHEDRKRREQLIPGQAYWTLLMTNEWTDPQMVTVQAQIPKIDSNTGFQLVAAYACDAHLPQLTLGAYRDLRDQQRKPAAGLPVGFYEDDDDDDDDDDNNINKNNGDEQTSAAKANMDGSHTLPISILPGRIQDIQIVALYKQKKGETGSSRYRLYTTGPISLLSAALEEDGAAAKGAEVSTLFSFEKQQQPASASSSS